MEVINAVQPIGFGTHPLADDMFAIHTDGFAALGVTEIAVTGHRDEIPAMAQVFLKMIQTMFDGGKGIMPTEGNHATFGHIRVYFGDVTARVNKIAPDLVVKAKQLRHDLRMIQMVICDEEGRMPWESCNPDKGQAVFCDPPAIAATSTVLH